MLKPVAILDRASTRLLGEVKAGACVPEHGDYCGCNYDHSQCYKTNYRYDYRVRYVIDCYGRCVRTSTVCRKTSVYDTRCP
jgi:hypothetical protein